MTINRLARLLIVSTATGYGGAERSMELLAPELARHVDVVVMTGNARHRRNLVAAAERAGVRMPVWNLSPNEGRPSMMKSALHFTAARLALRPDVVLANTRLSARVIALATRVWPGAGRRSWLYVRDFQWPDLASIFARLPQAGVLIPNPAVLDRAEYLAPHVEPTTNRRVRIVPNTAPHVESTSHRRVRVIPDMVKVINHPASAINENGYVLHLATVNPWKGHVHLIRAAQILRSEGREIWIAHAV